PLRTRAQHITREDAPGNEQRHQKDARTRHPDAGQVGQVQHARHRMPARRRMTHGKNSGLIRRDKAKQNETRPGKSAGKKHRSAHPQGTRGTGFAGPLGAAPPPSGEAAQERGEAASAAQGGVPNPAQGGALYFTASMRFIRSVKRAPYLARTGAVASKK